MKATRRGFLRVIGGILPTVVVGTGIAKVLMGESPPGGLTVAKIDEVVERSREVSYDGVNVWNPTPGYDYYWVIYRTPGSEFVLKTDEGLILEKRRCLLTNPDNMVQYR